MQMLDSSYALSGLCLSVLRLLLKMSNGFYSAENLAVICHEGLNLLSRAKETKVGVKTKGIKAGMITL